MRDGNERALVFFFFFIIYRFYYCSVSRSIIVIVIVVTRSDPIGRTAVQCCSPEWEKADTATQDGRAVTGAGGSTAAAT